MDYHMPGLNGIDVIKQSRKIYVEEGFSFPQTLILTAIADPRLKRSCVHHVDHFMEKPPTCEGLKEVFDQL
jgi:CheY-like chemotaxis protein